jgi:hypothetical protein
VVPLAEYILELSSLSISILNLIMNSNVLVSSVYLLKTSLIEDLVPLMSSLRVNVFLILGRIRSTS